MSSLRLLSAAALALALAAPAAQAEPGVTPDSIAFAQVAALDGPAAALGIGMREGMLAAFEEANAKGGVFGRKLSLESFDDGYEPDRSVSHVKALIAGGAHFGLIGAVGTPTSKAVQPATTEAKIPMIGPFTGAGFLRDAALGNVWNLRAPYSAETEAWIAHLVDGLGMKNIAILYQDDGFGRVGLDGVEAALKRRGMELVGRGSYTRNTTAVKAALLDIKRAKPEAVVMVGAYKPIAAFIKLAKKVKMDATFVNISFVGSKALAGELGDDGEGVIISQVVPFPWDASLPAVAAYQAAMKAVNADAEPGFVSLEGYLVGRMAIAALEAAGPDLTRESFLTAFSTLSVLDLGGVEIKFSPTDNQGVDDVFLTRIRADGTFEPVTVGSGT
ncbi:MAG: ABC-type branched-subunit amino acid transport system substrate-binding protein [Paracoccaceae bacterium]|jgi:ABC-type branched-subunit amino acid transport system substrate-binding protein